MPELLKEELLLSEIGDDGWPTLDWHDWRLGMKTSRDKNLLQYMEKQAKEAVAWYSRFTGEEIPGYDRKKNLLEYGQEVNEKINKAVDLYLEHVDEVSGLKGSENFARKNLMYREDLSPEEIEDKYKKWEKKEAHPEQVEALV